MNTPTFLKGLTILKAHFPKLDVPKETVNVWRQSLGDLSEKEFIKGITDFCKVQAEIYPGTNIVAKIRAFARKDPDQQTAMEAWGDVLIAVKSYGMNKPAFQNSITERVVRGIGWRELNLSENIGIERAHFIKAYDVIQSKQNTEALL